MYASYVSLCHILHFPQLPHSVWCSLEKGGEQGVCRRDPAIPKRALPLASLFQINFQSNKSAVRSNEIVP
jgi:hypothetical protein